ncbi:MAG: VOC family protein, partial [Myxococcota bacterium]
IVATRGGTVTPAQIEIREGSPIDHLALCGPDTRDAVARMAELTGVTAELRDPEPDQYYWSATIPLGQSRFLEILGPNPEFRGFNPFIETVRQFDGLRPVFWYVGTRDFEAFRVASKRAGAPVERIETVTLDRDGERFDYTRGILGPGFKSARPCVIEWRERPPSVTADSQLRLTALRLADPDAASLRETFAALGIEQTVEQGPASLAVDLETPEGPITFEGPGLEFRGVGALVQMARLYVRHRLSRTS